MAPPSAQEIQYQIAHIHQDRSNDIVVSHSICIVIAVVAVVLRFYSRRLCKASILADDYMTVVALILAAAQVGGGLMCVHYGGGKHAVLLKNPETFAKWVIATEELYNAAITAVKLSILLLYRRLFPDHRFKIALCIVGGFVDKAKKLQLIGVFSLGSLTCGVSLYRIPQMADISLSDAPWSDVKPCVWAVVEVCLGILGACLPTFPALFRWKTVRNSRRPSALSHSTGGDSSHYPILTPDERRSGFRSGVGNAHKEFLKMIDWADVPRAVEKKMVTR
ncbi:hypothetical protein IMSHALPRED_010636 [Imshaugia aleurites]|uniref:Rhodopsin domain-containing protein n=1 Tax=Imshaugia aleurites TaxID=172621 RepID=A0A8H3I916_9LECA|nr:hypothetical protein IMSHALPRED_010636 [Imshaugia aleurites]